MLIVFGGLPGTGKTTLAQRLARERRAVHVRIDSIEQAIVDSRIAEQPLGPSGYMVGYAVAFDNLRLGLSVIADSVNPIDITRNAWRDVGARAGVPVIEIEVICSDPTEHRARVESRPSTVPNLRLPTWREVVEREYHPWDHEHLCVDTAHRSLEDALVIIREGLVSR